MNEELLTEYNQFRNERKQPPLAPVTKYKSPRSVRVSDTAWTGIKQLAERLGYTHYDGGNITQLLEAIGHGLWELKPIDE